MVTSSGDDAAGEDVVVVVVVVAGADVLQATGTVRSNKHIVIRTAGTLFFIFPSPSFP